MSAAPDISVVIPTGGEVGDLGPVSASVGAVLTPLGWSYEVLPVDGDPPHEDQERRSGGVRGIEDARGTYVVVMDADLSHPADRIPDMIRLLETGESDLVIGSRGAAGGSLEGTARRPRRLRCRIATWLARPLVGVRDPLSRFLAFARCRLPASPRVSANAYRIGLDLMVRGGFERILEVPICLGDSSNGTSRLTWREQWRFLRQLRGLYRHRYPVRTEFVQFGLVGVSGFVVDVSAYLGLQFLFGLQHHLARGLSFWVSASWNWAWNRAVTFSDRRRTRKRLQWPAFILSSLLGFLMNWGTYYALTSTLPFFDGGVTRILAMFLGVVAGMGLNFVLARTFVFARVA